MLLFRDNERFVNMLAGTIPQDSIQTRGEKTGIQFKHLKMVLDSIQ